MVILNNELFIAMPLFFRKPTNNQKLNFVPKTSLTLVQPLSVIFQKKNTETHVALP